MSFQESSPNGERVGMREAIRAVVPVGGLGTRVLPATKAVPKEMLPLVDRPVIQYIVEEAVRAGSNQITFVTNRNKGAIEDHFDIAYELEDLLTKKNDLARLAAVREPNSLASISYVRQGLAGGLGHAVLAARAYIGDSAFTILLGDDLVEPQYALLERMMQVQHQFGGCVLALMEVEPERVSRHGCAQITATPMEDVVRVTDLVEKPALEDAPSRWAVIGRYVCDPQILDVLDRTEPGLDGELQLTDALKTLANGSASDGNGPVHGVLYRGKRYDTGNKQDYAQTFVEFALKCPEIAPEFTEWLRRRVVPLEKH